MHDTAYLYDALGRRLYLTPGEGEAFLRTALGHDRPVRTFCSVLYYTGCRISEALHLTPRRVDFADQVIIVESLKKRRTGVYRAVPVPPVLLDTLDIVHGLKEIQRRARRRELDEPLWSWSRTTASRRVVRVQGIQRVQEIQTAFCAGRRMAQQAAHLVEQVLPWVPTRQWVVSVPMPLRYWMAPSKALTARVHTIIRRTIGQYDVHHAVQQRATRATVQPGSVTFVQRFGGSINAHVHLHVVFLEGVFVERTAQGLTPRFLPADPPTDTDIATVLQTISRRVIRQLRKLDYLEADTEDVVPTGYDPASDEAPELARTLAASVQQRIAFSERAGQQVRRIGSGFGDAGERPTLTGTRCASVNGFSLHANTSIPAHRREQLARLLRYTARGAVSLVRLEGNADGDLLSTFTHPWSDGTTGITRSPMELLEKLAALVPLPRQHQVRYGGCLAPHSHLRAAIIPTPRQQGLEAPEDRSPSPHWTWARLLKRVFALENAARCVSRAGCGSSQRSLRVTSSRKCCGTCSWRSTHRPLRQRAKPPLRGTAPARNVLSGPTCARCGPFSCAGCPSSPSR